MNFDTKSGSLESESLNCTFNITNIRVTYFSPKNLFSPNLQNGLLAWYNCLLAFKGKIFFRHRISVKKNLLLRWEIEAKSCLAAAAPAPLDEVRQQRLDERLVLRVDVLDAAEALEVRLERFRIL